MTSYDVVSGDRSTLAVKINSTQTSGIQIGPMTINGTSTAWGNSAGVLEIAETVEGSYKREWIYYTGISTASDNTVTLSGVSRDISRSASSLSGSGTGQSFNKGADVRFVDFHYLFNQKVDNDRADTVTAAYTFGTGGEVLFSGTDKAGLVVKSLTTTQRDALASVSNGAIIYNSSTGVMNQYIGGAWTTFATGTISNATNGSSGKVDLATAAEVAAGTSLDASSGASNVIPVAICTTSSAGAGDSGKIPALGADGAIAVSLGGTGLTTLTANNLLVGAGSSDVTFIAPGSSGTFLKSNGTTASFGAVTSTQSVVYIGAADSTAIGASSTSDIAFDTHTYSIGAGDLVAGVSYEVEGIVAVTLGAATVMNLAIGLGSTVLAQLAYTIAATGDTHFRGAVTGTAAAGASVAVRAMLGVEHGATTGGHAAAKYSTANVATNGTLVLQMFNTFGTSNGGNSAVLKMLTVKKVSTTAF